MQLLATLMVWSGGAWLCSKWPPTCASIHSRPLVVGDFNGVPWPSATRRLTTVSERYEVRIEPRLLPPFDVNAHLAPWPLDYFFVTR